MILKEYSGIYILEQLFYLLFLVEISNASENVTKNRKAFQGAFVACVFQGACVFHGAVIKKQWGGEGNLFSEALV